MKTPHRIFVAALLFSSAPLSAATPSWVGNLTKTNHTISASWDAAGNQPQTRYLVEASTRSDFQAGTVISSQTVLLSATVDALRGNSHYFVRLSALDPTPSDFAEVREITTLASPAAPQILGDVFVPDPTGITVHWFSNDNAEGTTYRVKAYLDEELTHSAGSGNTTNTSLHIGSLHPNRRHWFTVQADNIAESGSTAVLIAGSTYTLSGDYSLTSTPPASNTIWYGADKSAITFMTDALASGNVAYFRYRWERTPTAAWPPDDHQENVPGMWDPAQGDLVQSNASTGQFYLHIKAYNAAGKSNANGVAAEKIVGRFNIDVVAPTPAAEIRDVIKNGNSMTWNAIPSSDDSGVAVRYGWKLGDGVEQFNVSNASVTANLLANTAYTMTLRTRDTADSPNFTASATKTEVTLQKLPTSVQILGGVTENSIPVQINGDFPNLTEGDSGLQVQAGDVVSEFEQSQVIVLHGLTPNTPYSVRGCSRNQAGEVTGCTASVVTRTLGGSSSVSADHIPYNPPTPGGKYPGGETILFTDNGAYANHLVSYYTMLLNGYPERPSSTAQKGGIVESDGVWSWAFNDTQEVYAHIQSYDGGHNAILGGYSLLGPWIIDASAPVERGGSTVTVTGVSQMIFKAGDVMDEGLAGMHAAPYSFDNGLTFQAQDTFTLSGPEITANSLHVSTVVFKDEVGNVSQAIYLKEYTHQNAPESISLVSQNGKQAVVKAEGNFPGLKEGLSGIQFGEINPDSSINWRTGWLNTSSTTLDFGNNNATYRITARARNASTPPVVTVIAPELIVHTQSIEPALLAISNPNVWTADPVFKFRAGATHGTNTYDHYLYVWTQNPTYAFDHSLTEMVWEHPNEDDILPVTAASAGKWYLHVRAVNTSGTQTATKTFGWFGYDNVAPENVQLDTPVVAVRSIDWFAAIATDTMVGLHQTDAYLWSLDGQAEKTTPHTAPNRAHLVSNDLLPNTAHRMSLRVQDRLGLISAPIFLDARTRADLPRADVFEKVQKTSATVSFSDGGNPSGTRFVVEISAKEDFNPLHELAIPVTSGAPGKLKAEFGVSGTPLSPNTTYYVRARAFNEDNVPTFTDVHLGTFTTQPLAPFVIVTPGIGSYAEGTAFTAQSQVAWGPGSIEYLRWVWDTNPAAYNLSPLDERADALNPIISTTTNKSGTYYLHVTAYSGGSTINSKPETQVVGPFTIMAPNGSDPRISSIDKTDTTISVHQSPLPDINEYGFQLDNGEIFYADNPNYTFTATPNTKYTVHIYIKDGAQQQGPYSQEVTTLQRKPTRIDATNITATSVQLTAVAAEAFQNVGVSPNTAFHFTLRSFYNPILSWSSSETFIKEGLEPNTLYTVTVRTRNSAGNDDNIESAEMSFTTLAIAPTPLVIKPVGHDVNGYFSLPKKFEFERGQGANANWGRGSVEYLRVITSNDSVAPDFTDESKSAVWIAVPRYSTEPVTAATYYMHFRSYNSANIGGPVYTYGPVYIDNQPPLPNPPTLDKLEVFVSSIIWTATKAIDQGGPDLPSLYHFHFGAPPDQDFPRDQEYRELNLLPNTTHSINLAVSDRLGNTTQAQVFAATTLAATPLPVLASLKVFITSATFDWDKKNNSKFTRYEIGAFTSDNLELDLAFTAEVGIDVSSGSITHLNLGTLYSFAVRAINSNGIKTPWAGVGNGTTKDEMVAPTIELLMTQTNNAVMTWDDSYPPGTTFDVALNGQNSDVGAVFMHRFEPLTPNTTYTFGVRAKKKTGTDTYRYSSFESIVAVTSAATPVNGTLAIHRTSATVTWGRNSNPEEVTRYEIRAATSANLNGAGNLTAMITGTEGQVTGLVPDTQYFFVVRAINHAGVPSDWLIVNNGVTGVQPPQPPYLYKSTTTTSFRLEWGSGTNPARVSYVIERSNDNFVSNIVQTTSPDLFVNPTGLNYNTTYYYRGKAVGTHGNESAVVPMDFIVTYATNPKNGVLVAHLQSLDVSWDANTNPEGTAYFVVVANNLAFHNPDRQQRVVGTSTLIDGLSQNTTFWVKIYAENHAETLSALPANAGYAVTLASTPIIPILTAKWDGVSDRGNYVLADINAGDLNPDHTEYAIFSVKNDGYLTGDAQGSVSPNKTWHTRFEWNSTSIHEGMGIHGLLSPRTDYQYKVIARNHAGIQTDFSKTNNVKTVPGKPNLTASVVDNDYVRLNWEPWEQTGADALRVYVSETGTEGSFVQYYDTVNNQSIHTIKPEGKKGVDEIPNSLFETRHDTDGGTPTDMPVLKFNQAVDATTDTLHFAWDTVASPSAAPLFYYYVVGLGGFGEEGEPSAISPPMEVHPVIKNYVIKGSRTGSTVDSDYLFLAPAGDAVTIPELEANTHLRVQVKARSSDEVDSKIPSPEIDAWTRAHIPGTPVVTTAFDDVNGHAIYNNILISTAGNPIYTEYAIKWMEGQGNKYLAGSGGTSDTPVWETKARWDRGYNHARLLSATQYSYQVIARNGAGVVTDPSSTSQIETIGFQPPTQLSGKGLSPASIRWTWYDNTTDEVRFEIIEKIDTTLNIKATLPSVSVFTTGFVYVEENVPSAPNTPVTRYVRGVGAKGASALSISTTAWTLAAAPEVNSLNHTKDVQSIEIKFQFKTKDGFKFGPGTAEYYRTKFSDSPTYTFTGTEDRWDDDSKTVEYRPVVTQDETTWYLHVMSYNHDDTPWAQSIVYGPYPLKVDVEAPVVEEISQDGAAAISGGRDVSALGSLLKAKKGEIKTQAILTIPQLDASFASSVPWAPMVQNIYIRFSKRLDRATLKNESVLVYAIQDNLSQTIAPKKAEYEVGYNDSDDSGLLTILFKQPGLLPGHLFEVRFTADAKDVAGNALPVDYRYYFRTFMDPKLTNEMVTLDPNGGLNMRVHFPAGSLPEVGSVGIETDPGAHPWGFDNGLRQNANQKQISIGGLFATPLTERFIGYFNAAHARTDGKLHSGAILSMPYKDEDNDGYVDSMPSMTAAQRNGDIKVKVANLSIYRFDEPTQLWVKVPGSHVDAENKMVVAVTYNMGVFAVIGTASSDVGSTYAFPVPFVASRDQSQGIKFANLPDAGEIKIYTVAGELVKEIQFGPGRPDPLPWDVKNESGQNVGADVYLYHITSGGNKKTGKLVIVR